MSPAGPEPIRSYQRIFRPQRRIYQVEGRSLPVPGGVPLGWLGWLGGALAAVVAIGSGSPLVLAAGAGAAGLWGLVRGGRGAAVLAAALALAGIWLAGVLLGVLDWPLRLVVVPLAVATLATQATPDGRRADRFAASWLALRLGPRRRSLGRVLPAAGETVMLGGRLWVGADEHSPSPRRGRVRGPATVAFAEPVAVRRAGKRGRLRASAPRAGRPRRRELLTERLALGEGETLEVRP